MSLFLLQQLRSGFCVGNDERKEASFKAGEPLELLLPSRQEGALAWPWWWLGDGRGQTDLKPLNASRLSECVSD